MRVSIAIVVTLLSATASQAEGITGTWEGSYTCAQGKTGLRLYLTETSATHGNGIFEFFHLRRPTENNSGSFAVMLDITDGRNLTATPGEWVKKPRGFGSVGFSAKLADDGKTIEGRIASSNCSELQVSKSSDDVPEAIAATKPVAEVRVVAPDWSGLIGQWRGVTVGNGFLGAINTDLYVTEKGAILSYDKLTLRCELLISPQPLESGRFRAVPYRGQDDCPQRDITLAVTDGELSLDYPVAFMPKPGALLHVINPAAQVSANAGFDILGLSLGDNLSEMQSKTEAETVSTVTSHLNEFRTGGQLSFGGISKETALEADYVTARWKISEASGDLSAGTDEDVIAAYSTTGERIDAIMRVYTPLPANATSLTSYLDALVDKYGTAHRIERSGNGQTLSWHYDKTGRLMSKDEAEAKCSGRGEYGQFQETAAIKMKSDSFNVGRHTLYPKKEVHSAQIKAYPGCGSTLSAYLFPQDDGTVEILRMVAYDHTALSNSLWTRRSKPVTEEVDKALQLVGERKGKAPKL